MMEQITILVFIPDIYKKGEIIHTILYSHSYAYTEYWNMIGEIVNDIWK